MTIEEHNRTLGILHLVYAGLQLLFVVLMAAFMALPLAMIGTMPNRGDAPPMAFFALVLGFILVLSLLMLIPPAVAGYGLLKRKPWARTAGIVAAVLATLNFPHGTALAVYSFWFLFGDGARLYKTAAAAPGAPYTLNDAPPRPASEWFAGAGREGEREARQSQPRGPGDWR